MAERKRRRLTNRMQDGCAYVQSETGKEGVGHYTTQRRLPELITFTCKVEDIMEKYHCNDIEELEKKLADSDTWQKACELACETMTKLGGDDCCGCRLNKEM